MTENKYPSSSESCVRLWKAELKFFLSTRSSKSSCPNFSVCQGQPKTDKKLLETGLCGWRKWSNRDAPPTLIIAWFHVWSGSKFQKDQMQLCRGENVKKKEAYFFLETRRFPLYFQETKHRGSVFSSVQRKKFWKLARKTLAQNWDMYSSRNRDID